MRPRVPSASYMVLFDSIVAKGKKIIMLITSTKMSADIALRSNPRFIIRLNASFPQVHGRALDIALPPAGIISGAEKAPDN